MNRVRAKRILTSSLMIGLVLLSSCKKEEALEAENLIENVQTREVEEVEELPIDFLQANANFSLDLFKKLANEENVVFSPVPVYYSLALLANGADEAAQNEILESLALDDLTLEEVNGYYHELIERLENDKKDVELNLSNSIWYDQDFKANEEFLETNKSYYGTDSYRIDFTDAKAPLAMNDWVSEVTNGKIEEMVEEMNPEAVMYLFSTIYFDADWEMPFKGSDTYESEFLVDGEELEVEKMTGRFELETVETADEEGIVLPYQDDRYSFIALLPDESTDIRDYLSTFNEAKLPELIQEVKEEEVDLLIPKFEVNFENVLNTPLQNLGIESIFDARANHLSPMGTADGNLFVSEIFQKTYLTLDEKGTEAASAVGTEISETSLPMETRIIDFNRPFLYSIIEKETGLPIFLGIMDQPVN